MLRVQEFAESAEREKAKGRSEKHAQIFEDLCIPGM